MAADEIIDPTGQRQERTRRKLRRVFLPILGVSLVVGSMFVIGYHSYNLVRANTVRLSNDLLVATQNYIAQEVAAYLAPATLGADIAQDLLQHGALSSKDRLFDFYAGSMLRQVAQIQAFYLANSDGEFALMQRNGGSGTEIVIVAAKDGKRVRSVYQNGANGDLISREPDQPSTYDPRDSDYYKLPIKTGEPYWSQPYIFKPTGQPVITTSVAYRSTDTRNHVFAVNISLDRLSAFLGSLKIGEHGHALIAQRDGRIIASPDLVNMHGDPTQTRIDADGATGADTPLSRAFNMFRVQGYGPRGFSLDGKDYISIAAKLPSSPPDWVLLIVMPTKDFAAFRAQDSRSTLIYTSLTVALAMLLAGLLIQQGRRVEQVLQEMTARNERAEEERQSLHRLMSQPDIFDAGAEAPLLTEQLAEASLAQRASIWRLSRNGRALRCEDIYDRRQKSHMGGFSLDIAEAGPLLDAIRNGEAFSVNDAAADQRTERLFRLHMRPANTRALLVVPIAAAHGIAGAVLLEDAARIADSRHIVGILGGIAGIRLRGEETAEQDATPSPAPADQPGAIPAIHGLAAPPLTGAYLLPPPGQEDGAVEERPESGFFPAIAALVITFDVQPLTELDGKDAAIRLVSDISAEFQDIARTHGLFSVKLIGHRLFAVSGCTETPDPLAALRVADAALAIRDRCLARLAGEDTDPAFHIGMDTGAAIGAWLGREPAVFNIWGNAVRGAEAMAQSNPLPGSIQVTEAAYKMLRSHFLFLNRGAFYTPGTGISRAYSLAGRQ